MRRALVPALVLVGLVSFAPLAAALSIPMPLHAVGDHWTYAITVTDAGAVVEEGERHVAVVARRVVAYHGQPRETFLVGAWENVTAGGETSRSQSTTAYDARTGAFLFTTTAGHDTVSAQPCEQMRYPVEDGKSWTTTCQVEDATSETLYVVAGGERVTVPAGTYDTLAVDLIGDLTARYWLAVESCGRAVAEFQQVNDRASYANLTKVSCTRAGAATPPGGGATPGGGPGAGTTTTTTTTPPTTGAPAPAAPPLPYPTLHGEEAWVFQANTSMGGEPYRVQTQIGVLRAWDTEDARDRKHRANHVTEFVGYYKGAEGFYLAPEGAFKVMTNARVGDGAVVTEEHEWYNNTPPFPHAYGLRREYAEPCAFVRWPVTPGTTWPIACSGTWWNTSASMQHRLPFTVTGEGRADAARVIQTRGGEFLAYPVHLTFAFDGEPARQRTIHYAKETCGPAQLSLDGRFSTALQSLHEYRCDGAGNMEPPRESDSPGVGAALLVAAAGALALVLRKRS